MPVRFSAFNHAREFLDVAGPLLYARETANNLILGVSERLVDDPEAYQNPFFAAVRAEDGQVILAAVMTPPHNLILAGEAQVEAGFPALIEHLQSRSILVPGVIAQAPVADLFARAWTQQVGQTGKVTMNSRTFALQHVHMPPVPPGDFAMADPYDIPTITAWLQAFELEALGETHALDRARAARLVGEGNLFVWRRGNEIVSMAMKTRPIAHSIAISAVYTPPERRRQGYAGALVATLSQRLLDEGYQFVTLFTDLDNPTSNKIYQAVGFRPVCDFRSYRFIEPANG
jgi:uncharacterized protein